jgi:hypothetical protein
MMELIGQGTSMDTQIPEASEPLDAPKKITWEKESV